MDPFSLLFIYTWSLYCTLYYATHYRDNVCFVTHATFYFFPWVSLVYITCILHILHLNYFKILYIQNSNAHTSLMLIYSQINPTELIISSCTVLKLVHIYLNENKLFRVYVNKRTLDKSVPTVPFIFLSSAFVIMNRDFGDYIESLNGEWGGVWTVNKKHPTRTRHTEGVK